MVKHHSSSRLSKKRGVGTFRSRFSGGDGTERGDLPAVWLCRGGVWGEGLVSRLADSNSRFSQRHVEETTSPMKR